MDTTLTFPFSPAHPASYLTVLGLHTILADQPTTTHWTAINLTGHPALTTAVTLDETIEHTLEAIQALPSMFDGFDPANPMPFDQLHAWMGAPTDPLTVRLRERAANPHTPHYTPDGQPVANPHPLLAHAYPHLPGLVDWLASVITRPLITDFVTHATIHRLDLPDPGACSGLDPDGFTTGMAPILEALALIGATILPSTRITQDATRFTYPVWACPVDWTTLRTLLTASPYPPPLAKVMSVTWKPIPNTPWHAYQPITT